MAVTSFRGCFFDAGKEIYEQRTITEADDLIEVCTYNTDLKKRLAAFAGKYPSECRPLDDDGNGCVTYEVRKGRLSFRLTAPYTEERKKAASEAAKKNTGNLKVAQD